MNTKPLRTIAAIAIATLLFVPSANASKVGDFFSGIWGIFSTLEGTTATYSNDAGQSVTVSKAQAAKLTNLPVDQRSAAVLGILASKFPGSAMGLDSFGHPIAAASAPVQGAAENPATTGSGISIPAEVITIIKTVKPEWAEYINLATGLASGSGIFGIAAFFLDRARRKHKKDAAKNKEAAVTIIEAIGGSTESKGHVRKAIGDLALLKGNSDHIKSLVREST